MEMLETDWWTLEIPPEFEVSQEDDLVIIEDEDGVGCLEISTLVREEGRVGAAEIAEFSLELRESGIAPQRARIGGWSGELYEHEDDGFHWREWFLGYGSLFVYAAYQCLPENAGMDDAAIDEILETLEPKG